MAEEDDAGTVGEPARFVSKVAAHAADLASPATREDLARIHQALLEQPATKGDLQDLAATIPNLNGALEPIKRVAGMEPRLQQVIELVPPLQRLAALEPEIKILVTEALPDWRAQATKHQDREAFWRVLGNAVKWRYSKFVIGAGGVALTTEWFRQILFPFAIDHHWPGF